MFSVDVYDTDGKLAYTRDADSKEAAEAKIRFFSGWRNVSRIIVSYFDPVTRSSSKLAVLDSDHIHDQMELSLPPGIFGGVNTGVQSTLDVY